ncbi:MAG TPA: hypothetical protein VFS21_17105 [Roseiflexaceae bacterium]|nr:hypothetical protein [Roseiflexaceae bacterium]
MTPIASTASIPGDGQGTLFRVDRARMRIAYVCLAIAALFFMLLTFWFVSFITGGQLFTPVAFAIEIALAIMLLFAFGVAVRWQRETWLRLTPDGIEYHSLGLAFTTPWSNVAGLNEHNELATLLLSEHPTYSVRNRKVSRHISLAIFTRWSPESPLYQEIRRYAPHLFGHEAAAQGS